VYTLYITQYIVHNTYINVYIDNSFFALPIPDGPFDWGRVLRMQGRGVPPRRVYITYYTIHYILHNTLYITQSTHQCRQSALIFCVFNSRWILQLETCTPKARMRSTPLMRLRSGLRITLSQTPCPTSVPRGTP